MINLARPYTRTPPPELPLDQRVALAVARMRANWERYNAAHGLFVDYDYQEPLDYYSDSEQEYEEDVEAEDPDDEWAEIKMR